MSLPIEPLFAKTQSAYDTTVADSLAANPFNWKRAPEPTPEPTRSYQPRTQEEQQFRPYSTRFKSVEAYEAHKANARAWAKAHTKKATAARMKLNATRVNLPSAFNCPIDGRDSNLKSAVIQGSSNWNRTA